MDTADLGTRMVDAHNAGDDQALLAIYAHDATVHFAGWAAPVDAGSWVAAQVGIRESSPDLRSESAPSPPGPGGRRGADHDRDELRGPAPQ